MTISTKTPTWEAVSSISFVLPFSSACRFESESLRARCFLTYCRFAHVQDSLYLVFISWSGFVFKPAFIKTVHFGHPFFLFSLLELCDTPLKKPLGFPLSSFIIPHFAECKEVCWLFFRKEHKSGVRKEFSRNLKRLKMEPKDFRTYFA